MGTRPIVLLTNDDGIGAPGLEALERALASQEIAEVWTVAPARGQSTTSHGMTLYRPVFVEELGPRRFAVDALPSDCVYLAMFGLLPRMPAVVLSGINRGANLGQDVIYSGTVAAAREAVVRGVSGVAVSLVHGTGYDEAAHSAAAVALAVAQLSSSTPMLLNLNYPDGVFQGPQLAPLGQRRYPWVVDRRVSPGGATYYWLGGPEVQDEEVPGSDGWLVARGIASATPLHLDQCRHDDLAEDSPVAAVLRSLA